jgi:hypothetical protein
VDEGIFVFYTIQRFAVERCEAFRVNQNHEKEARMNKIVAKIKRSFQKATSILAGLPGMNPLAKQPEFCPIPAIHRF